MTRAGTPLAEETREVILDLRASGWPDEAIAAQVGRTAGSIRHIIATAREKGDPRAAYLTDEERRRRIIVNRNAALGRSVPDALRGGGSVHPASAAPISSGACDEAPEAGRLTAVGSLPSECDCAGPDNTGSAAFFEDALEKAFFDGYSVAQLAARFDRHPHTIRRILSRQGLAHYVDDVKPAQKLDPAERRCLGGCGKMFASKWIGNRVCDRCRGTDGVGARR